MNDFNPYKYYDHLLECVVFFLNCTWILRGTKEPQNLLVPDVDFGCELNRSKLCRNI